MDWWGGWGESKVEEGALLISGGAMPILFD